MSENINKKKFNLGQVIYILSENAQTIIPAIVEEEFFHRKLTGESFTYKITIGAGPKKKTIDLQSINGKIFSDIGEVRTVLLNRFTEFVNELVETAQTKSKNWYGIETKNINQQISSNTINQQSNSAFDADQQRELAREQLKQNVLAGIDDEDDEENYLPLDEQ